MKECTICNACFEDDAAVCLTDGDTLRTTFKGSIDFNEKYRLNRRLGQGGMGTVYEATQLILQRRVAIKVLQPNYRNPMAKERFHREALAIARLKHPNIVSVYDFGFSEEGYAYLVMEFIAGFQLRHVLERWSHCGLEFGIDIARQICEAMAMAHTCGVLHRDLKPENVMFEGLLSECVMKLVDFGLAKLTTYQAPKLTSPNMVVGTYTYMSPEQCRGLEIDERSDIYGLGVLFYEMFVGRAPFIGEDPLEIMELHLGKAPVPPSHYIRNMPAKLEELLLSALEKEPDQRPNSAQEMSRALSDLLISMSQQHIPLNVALADRADMLHAQSKRRAENDLTLLNREIQRYRFAAEKAADDPSAFQRLSELYQEAGRVEDSVEAHLTTGHKLYESGRLEAACLSYQKIRNLVNLDQRAIVARRLVDFYLPKGLFELAYKNSRYYLIHLLTKQKMAEAEAYIAKLPMLGAKDEQYRQQFTKLMTDSRQAFKYQQHSGWRRSGSSVKSDLSDQLVFIVEPDSALREQFGRAIKRLGCRVELLSSGEKTLELVNKQWPTLIIFEHKLTDMSGAELYRKMSQSSLARESGYICLSSNCDDQDMDAAFAQGIDDFWLKPINFNEIGFRVRRLLLQSRHRSQLMGRLSNHTFIEIIQQLERLRRTGVLLIRTHSEKAKVFFEKGVIVDAQLGNLPPNGSLYRILNWDEGRFHFRPAPINPEKPIHMTRRELMLSALNFHDEEHRTILQLPPLNTFLTLDMPEAIIAEPREQEIIKLFDGSRMLGDLLEHFRGDLMALRLALALYKTHRDVNLHSQSATVITPAPDSHLHESRIFTRRLNEAKLKNNKRLN